MKDVRVTEKSDWKGKVMVVKRCLLKQQKESFCTYEESKIKKTWRLLTLESNKRRKKSSAGKYLAVLCQYY